MPESEDKNKGPTDKPPVPPAKSSKPRKKNKGKKSTSPIVNVKVTLPPKAVEAIKDLKQTAEEIKIATVNTEAAVEKLARQHAAAREEDAKKEKTSPTLSKVLGPLILAVLVAIFLVLYFTTKTPAPPVTIVLPKQTASETVKTDISDADNPENIKLQNELSARDNDLAKAREEAASLKAALTKANDDANAAKATIAATETTTTKKDEITKADLANFKNDLGEKFDEKIALAKKEFKNEVASEAEKAPPAPVNETATVPIVDNTTQYVKVLLIDNYNRVQLHLKNIPVSSITRGNGQTNFLTEDGKIICWPQKIMFSYPYTKGSPQKIGAIFYTPKIAGAAVEVMNVSACDVYLDDNDGSLRFDNHHGEFPTAQKGAGFTDSQQALPIQP